jgi:hypothetical protein
MRERPDITESQYCRGASGNDTLFTLKQSFGSKLQVCWWRRPIGNRCNVQIPYKDIRANPDDGTRSDFCEPSLTMRFPSSVCALPSRVPHTGKQSETVIKI